MEVLDTSPIWHAIGLVVIIIVAIALSLDLFRKG
jgi:hypothetical protein